MIRRVWRGGGREKKEKNGNEEGEAVKSERSR